MTDRRAVTDEEQLPRGDTLYYHSAVREPVHSRGASICIADILLLH